MNIDCPPHIRRTLEEITAEITGRQGEIQKLIDVRTSLCELYDIPAELPMGNLREKKPHKARKTKTAPAALASPATPPPVGKFSYSGRFQSAAITRVHRVDGACAQNARAGFRRHTFRGQRQGSHLLHQQHQPLGRQGLVGENRAR